MMDAPSLLSLPDQEVHLWYVSLDCAFDPATLDAYHALLSPDETSRYHRFAIESNRLQFLVGRALVRTTLSRYTDVPPTAWVFSDNGHGKPEVHEPSGYSALQFNLSHTNGMVACAVVKGHSIGVDVENVERLNVSVDLARYALSPTEFTTWKALPLSEQREAFVKYWTLKEAYVKARGLGMSLALQDISFIHRDDGTVALSFAPLIGDDPSRWQMFRLAVTESHRVAVAVCRGLEGDFTLVVNSW